MLMPSTPSDFEFLMFAKVMHSVSKSIGLTLKEQVMMRGSSVGMGPGEGGTLAAVNRPIDT